jgi:hypothetical protein
MSSATLLEQASNSHSRAETAPGTSIAKEMENHRFWWAGQSTRFRGSPEETARIVFSLIAPSTEVSWP